MRPALRRGRRKEARLTPFLVFLIAAVVAIVVVVVAANIKRRDERHRFEESSAQGRDHDSREHHR